MKERFIITRVMPQNCLVPNCDCSKCFNVELVSKNAEVCTFDTYPEALEALKLCGKGMFQIQKVFINQ